MGQGLQALEIAFQRIEESDGIALGRHAMDGERNQTQGQALGNDGNAIHKIQCRSYSARIKEKWQFQFAKTSFKTGNQSF